MNTLDREMVKGSAMTGMTLTKTRIQSGIWEGVLTAPALVAEVPELSVTHLGTDVSTVAVSPDEHHPGTWIVQVAIPPEVLCDGVQTFLIQEAASGETLASFVIVTGEPLDDDIRGEIDLLRAELDMLKSAFRRHCVETG